MAMSERQKKLLKAIIQEFIETANAVASLHLADKYNLPISSATIRNEMKSLADAGYLKQLHTSSGRIPTTTGLRYFIQELINEIEEIEILEQEKIKQAIYANRFSTEDLVREALKALVSLTHHPAIVIAEKDIYYAGLAEMLEIPEFQQIEQLRRLLRVLEDYHVLMNIFNDHKSNERVKVLIGDELRINDLDNYSLVFAEIKLHAGVTGYISTIGPIRMNYAAVIPAVGYISKLINQAVQGW